jgi:hypothetical protein
VIRPEWQSLIDLCLEAREADLDLPDAAGLASLAARLNVESYVLETLGPSQLRLAPETARWLGDLRLKVAGVVMDNLRRDEELREALARFEGSGIPCILLKGSALRVERPGLAGRFQCDVDVLLRRGDLERAEAILVELGFGLDESYLDRERLLAEHFHLGYQRRGAAMELHWDIDVASPPGFTDRLWERSRVVAREGQAFRVLAPEHQLLVACLHLSRHAFEGGLRWLADLRLLLPAPAEVRDRFAEEALAWPGRAAWCPLWLLACWGVPGSEAFSDGLEAGPAERRLLFQMVVPLLLCEPWMGLPAWRSAKALHAWLFSDRSLFSLLPGAWGDGLLSRVRTPEPSGTPAPRPQRPPA